MNTNPGSNPDSKIKKMSMSVITVASASKTGLNRNSRDPSFSSYLDLADETFVLPLENASTHISNPHNHTPLAKIKTKDDKEIDVFDAQKYFNEALHHHSPKPSINNSLSSPSSTTSHHQKKDEPLEIFAIKEKPSIATPSIRSESSWNSRSALLQAVPKGQLPRKAQRKSLLASIGCTCSCADKNSVDINDESKHGDKAIDHTVRKSQSDYNCVRFDEPGLKANSEGHFSFPIAIGNQAAKSQVFGSPIQEKKKPAAIAWDAIAPEEIKIPSNSMYYSDESDASSDLFEIESLSKGNPFLSRQASDGCVTPTTGCAPSEASIEWSVVTASAADFSFMSDCEELRPTAGSGSKKAGQKLGPFKEIPKLRPGILSGCKSHKAVRVAGDAHRGNEFNNARRQQLRSECDSFKPVTRFHDESKGAGFGARSRQVSFDSRSIMAQPAIGIVYIVDTVLFMVLFFS